MAVSIAVNHRATTHNLVLRIQLPEGSEDGSLWLDALYEAGCSDATVGLGRPGMLALDFSRETVSAEEAVGSAIADIRQAIPDGIILEISPEV